VIGSKDETAGCQGCVATVAEDGSIALRLRLPNALSGKYLSLRGLHFTHGRSGASRSSPSLVPDRDRSRLVTIPPEPVRPRHANRH
ncbi:MAG TPA: hypothetical protein VL087_08525, partial [Nitrospirota bacterium]|nr:hypothetical protein [Nitrospirota bacterium]